MGGTLLLEVERPREVVLNTLLDEIKEFCMAHADPAIVEKYARYFTEGYNPYGVVDSNLRPKREEWLNTYREELGLEGFLDLGDLLWQSGKYEEGFLAIYFVRKFEKEFGQETFERFGTWFDIGVWNWAHSDVLCGDLLEPLLVKGIVSLQAFQPWSESPFKYKRRAVPVTMLGLLKTTNNYDPLLDFICPLMLDREKVVQQGLGWFLREAWKRRPQIVEAFLLQWKDEAPRLIFQYATEKMAREEKERFRRAK